MRSPPWVCPRPPTPGGEEFWARYAPAVFSNVPGSLKALRFAIFAGSELGWVLFGNKKKNEVARAKLEKALLARMKRLAPAEYHDILTPDYSVACKRRIFDDTWYPSLNRSNVTLTTLRMTEIHEHSVTLGPGKLYAGPNGSNDSPETKTIPVDIIVRANGFETHQWAHPLKITGRDGKDLLDTMMERGGAQAYQGTAMDSFPNLFMIFGPNTATGHSSVIMASENMVDYAAKFIKLILNNEAKTVDVKREAEVSYTADIQSRLKDTVFHTGGCQSWYFSKDGWNSTVLPYNQIWFWYRCQFPKWSDWNIEYTTKGLVKLFLVRGLRLAALIAVFMAYRRFKQFNQFRKNAEMTWKDVGNFAKMGALSQAIGQVSKLKKQLVAMM